MKSITKMLSNMLLNELIQCIGPSANTYQLEYVYQLPKYHAVSNVSSLATLLLSNLHTLQNSCAMPVPKVVCVPLLRKHI